MRRVFQQVVRAQISLSFNQSSRLVGCVPLEEKRMGREAGSLFVNHDLPIYSAGYNDYGGKIFGSDWISRPE